MRRPRPMSVDDEVLRLVAIRCATEARGQGLGWCCSCPDGGWSGPLDRHYAAASRTLGRALTEREGEAFSEGFLAMIRLYPPEACEMHKSERASA